MSSEVLHHEHSHDHHHADATDVFGFWIYIMTDCMLFASLFATFAVLHTHTYGHLGLKDLVSLPYVLGETLFLLVSNLTFGFGILSLYKDKYRSVFFWLMMTFLLGFGFIFMEVNEFVHLIQEGHSYQTSGALSAFFTLVATHGLHVSFGLLWIIVMMVQVLKYKTVPMIKRRLTYLGLFWNFLDIVWIFVFTIVYLMGVL
jgi:cytochrome o ubiquinol oxidase subunit III